MNKRKAVVFASAGGLFIASALLSICLGASRLPLSDILGALLSGPENTAGYIFWYVRMPRTAACMLAGAALAASGAVIQAVLANKLASPGIIGVNSGAGLAVTICCAYGALSGWAIAGSAFIGAMIAVMLVVFVAEKTGASRTTVILGGVAVNGFLNAISEGIVTLVPEAAMLSGDFRVGGFSSVAYTRLLPAGALIIFALMFLLALSNELDVLALGEDMAHGLGMRVRRMRTLFLALAAMLAGAAVSFAGLLGFVGLLVPHAARKLVGNESRFMMPLCALGGAGFVTMCDVAARLIFAPYEIAVGIIMAVIGAPCFVILLIRNRGGRSYA